MAYYDTIIDWVLMLENNSKIYVERKDTYTYLFKSESGAMSFPMSETDFDYVIEVLSGIGYIIEGGRW